MKMMTNKKRRTMIKKRLKRYHPLKNGREKRLGKKTTKRQRTMTTARTQKKTKNQDRGEVVSKGAQKHLA